jgi:2-polyprenyl-3-methyl-5-hydroxy-6-metoxy-1,4-benzoquinol methylase
MFFLRKSAVRIKGKRVMDIGCGNGEFLLRCVKAGASHVLGVEPDIKMAQGIKNRFGIDVVNGFASQLSLANGQFDLIVLWDVLEHLAEPRRLLASIKGSLADGGKIAAVTPNGDGYLEEGINWTGFKVDFDHISYYGRESATRLFKSCGYQIEKMVSAGLPTLEGELLTGRVKSSTWSMLRHRLYELPVAGPALIKGASIRGLIENIGHNARGRYHLYLLAK